MGKAILVLDEMPKNCHECEPHRCMAYQFDLDYDSENRPSSCPLIELPGEAEVQNLDINYNEGFCDGWNTFRDEILEKDDFSRRLEETVKKMASNKTISVKES